MRILGSLWSPVLALSLASAGMPICRDAHAAPPSREEKKAIADASELYKQGRTKFEMAEYDEAISLWKEAYAKLPEGEDARAIKNDLVYNISEAQVRAYEIDHDTTHLRKAKVLLTDYLRNHETMYGSDKAAVKERAGARARLVEVDRMLESGPEGEDTPATPAAGENGPSGVEPVADTQPTDAQPTDAQPTETPSPEEQREREQQAAREARLAEIKRDPELSRQDKAARKRIVTGAVLGGVGITLGVGAYVAFSLYSPAVDATPDPTDLDPDPEPNNGALIAGIVLGVAALGLLGAGAGLFGSGMKARKQLRTPPSPAQALVVPWAGRGAGGAVMLLRF